MSGPPRVLIAEDNVLMANTIAAWVGRTCEVVGQIHDLKSVRPAITTAKPDVVLIDLAFGADSALLELPALVAAAPTSRFIVLTAYADTSLMHSALSAGAWGFVVKSSEFNEILHAIAEAVGGRIYVSERLLKPPPAPEPPKSRPRIVVPGELEPTETQWKLLKLMCAGNSLRATGRVTGQHHKSVEHHLMAMQMQLGLKTRQELKDWAQGHLDQQ